ncbi:MAG TPA: hypothetical protein VII56_01345 [Rhizomicrobium sp.]
MAQVIVSPREMRAFAQDLAELIQAVEARDRQLAEGLRSLGSTWADERYRTFSRVQSTTAAQLQIFYRMGKNYVQYLGNKATAAERYLGR